jgi:hypothetical protein
MNHRGAGRQRFPVRDRRQRLIFHANQISASRAVAIFGDDHSHPSPT